MDVKPAQIELSIDELIIDEAVIGRISPRALETLRAEVERELTHLLGGGAVPSHLQQAGQIGQLAAGRLARSPGPGPALGMTIAQSVYRSLGE
jgi:hypothetical protein